MRPHPVKFRFFTFCDPLVNFLRQKKHFLPQKAFFYAKKLFLRQKAFFTAKSFFLRQKVFFTSKLFYVKKHFSRQKTFS